MGSVVKSLLKSVTNLRFFKKRIDQGFLLKRIHGGPLEDTPYFSALSPEDYSPTRQFSSYLFEDFKVVLGSCNGLVCLDNTTKHSLLWNPSTNESKIIPSDYMQERAPTARDQCFAGGFGYDSRSDDFKLIRYIYRFGRHSFVDVPFVLKDRILVELYSLRTNSWKYIDFPRYFVLRKPSAYIDANHYWLAIDKNEQFVLKFNFADEELSDYPLPPDPDAGKHFGVPPNLDFVEFEGLLGVLFFPVLGTEKRFHLWVTDGEFWTKECEFLIAGVERPLGFWGRVLLFEGLNHQLMAYDIDTRDTKKVDAYDFPRKMQLVPYVESNVSIQGLFGTLQSLPHSKE